MKLSYIILLGILPLSVSAQTFSLRYDVLDLQIQNEAGSIEQMDNGYLILSSVVELDPVDLDIQLIQIGFDGQLLNDQMMGMDSVFEFIGKENSLSATLDNGYIMGSTSKGIGDDDNCQVRKFDSLGNLQWEYTHESDSLYYGYAATEGHDSCYYTVGSTNDIIQTGSYGVFLLKTDQQGEFEWVKKYTAGSYWSIGVSITPTPYNGFLLGCQTTEWDDDQDHDFMIIKTDSLGNEQWRKKWGGSVYSSGAAYVNMVSDNNYIMCSSLEDGLGNSNVSMRAYAAKIDTTGAFVWQNQYGPYSYPILLTKIEECTDGSFITAGMKQEQFNYHGLLMKLSSSGDSLWYRTYTYADELLDIDCILRDVIQTSDGGYIACGYTDAITDEESRDVWVLKVDSVGCLVPGCDVSILEEKQIANFLVYPNPANEVVNVYFESLFAGGVFQLYDTNGKLVKRFEANENKTTYILDTSSVEEGIYLMQYVDEIGSSISKQVLVVH